MQGLHYGPYECDVSDIKAALDSDHRLRTKVAKYLSSHLDEANLRDDVELALEKINAALDDAMVDELF